jgi:hypothetical protein
MAHLSLVANVSYNRHDGNNLTMCISHRGHNLPTWITSASNCRKLPPLFTVGRRTDGRKDGLTDGQTADTSWLHSLTQLNQKCSTELLMTFCCKNFKSFICKLKVKVNKHWNFHSFICQWKFTTTANVKIKSSMADTWHTYQQHVIYNSNYKCINCILYIFMLNILNDGYIYNVK